jgi:two-component system NtrC family sensor kinase
MRTLGVILYGFMALVLAAGWGFLFWQSSAVDLSSVEGARGALTELRAIDAGWNQQLVAARPRAEAAPPAPAAAPVSPSRWRTAYGRLEVRALGLGNALIGSELVPLRRALEEKSTLLAQHAAAPSEPLFERAWHAATGPRLDLLGRAIDRSYDDALTQAELYRVGLLYYSGFLLAVLVFLLWSLNERRRVIDRINLELRDANERLEARVAERTRELSEALKRLKESEAMLIQTEKMSSLGQMVAGIAHEVNTPLAYVKSSLEAVKKRVPQLAELAGDSEQLLALLSAEAADETALAAQFQRVRGHLEALRGRAALDELDKLVQDGVFGIAQISEIVGSLKDFSRLDRSKVASFDLHQGLDSTLRIAQQQVKDRQVRREFGPIPKISCSPSQINQVFLNLIANAAQATAAGSGVITLRTGVRGSTHVAVEVADNGHGIPPEVLPKIFDPFFTTKGVGKGTGLGLSICYKIVESHGGKLEVQSRPGAGTRFTVLLPLSPPAAA